MVGGHVASHYLNSHDKPSQSFAVDKAMRVSVPVIHLLSYPFAAIQGFVSSPYEVIIGGFIFVVDIVIVAVTVYLFQEPGEDLAATVAEPATLPSKEEQPADESDDNPLKQDD